MIFDNHLGLRIAYVIDLILNWFSQPKRTKHA